MHSDSFLSDMGPSDGERLSILSAEPSLLVPQYIRALSDAELIAATRALARGLLSYTWAVVPLVTASVAVTLGIRAALFSCVVTILLCKVALHFHEHSRAVAVAQLAKREFCMRYHIGALTLDETTAAAQLAQTSALELVVLFRAWALPHGGHRFIKITVGAEARAQIYQTPFLGDLLKHAASQSCMLKLDLPLTAAQVERLRTACEKLVSSANQSTNQPQQPPRAIMAGPLDGLPCDLVVLRRGAEALRVGMNFRGIASLHALTPSEGLVSEILDIEGQFTGTERAAEGQVTMAEHAAFGV